MIARLAAALPALFLVSGVHAQETDAAPASAHQSVICFIEEECLASLSRLARREGGSLVLTTKDAGEVVLADEAAPCEEGEGLPSATHRLEAYLPASGAFVVASDTCTGASAQLIGTQDGKRVNLATSPVFSPSGQRLVSVGPGVQRGSYDLSVWGRRDGEWVEEVTSTAREDDPEAWDLVGWDGDETIRFRMEATSGRKGDARLSWDGQGWQFHLPPRQ